MPTITAAQVQAYFNKVEKQFASFLTSKDLLVAAIEEKGGTIYYQTDPAFVAKYGPSIPVYADLDESILSIPTGGCEDVSAVVSALDALGGTFNCNGSSVEVIVNNDESGEIYCVNGVDTDVGTINSVSLISGVTEFFVASSTLKTISISESVRNILTKVTIPHGFVDNWNSLFKNCVNLHTVKTVDFNVASVIGDIFEGCSTLTSSNAYGARVSHSYKNCSLDETALNKVFTNLGVAKPGAAITVTGNPGAPTADISIAENKGWTVIV